MKKVLLGFFSLLLMFFASCFSQKSSSTIRIGIDPSFIPLDTMGQEKNLFGYTQEFFQKIGKDREESIELVPITWDNLLQSLRTGDVDGIISTMPPLNFYKKEFSFSSPMILTGPVLVCLKDKKISNLSDLNGKILGVVEVSNAQVIAGSESTSIIQTFESIPLTLDAVIKGQIDAAFIDYLPAYAFTQDIFSKNLKIVSKPYGESAIRLLVKISDKKGLDLLDWTNDQADSSFSKKLLTKYNLPPQN
jgi:ABC-type amino acid transport substrate-binding protein